MRVALCLSGLCHHFDEAYPLLKETIIDRYNPDIFCHFWQKDYTGVFESDAEEAVKKLDPYMYQLEPQHDLVDKFFSRYFNPNRKDCFTKEFHTKKSEVVTAWGRSNVLNMYYSIYKCNVLQNKSPHRYDIVIRARIDRSWELNHKLKTDSDKLWLHNLKGDLSDWFAYGPSHLMDIYSSVWLKLPSIAGWMDLSARTTTCNSCKQKVPNEEETTSKDSRLYRNWLNPHNCLATVLNYAGVNYEELSREEVRGHMVGEEARRAAHKKQLGV